jgi:hypothetical protein
VRRASDLGEKAAPDGFIPYPVYTSIEAEQSDFGIKSCAVAWADEHKLAKLDSTYAGHLDLVAKLSHPISQAFNVSQNMTFYELLMYTDTIFSRDFEGLDIYGQFTPEEMKLISEVNKWGQIKKVTPSSKNKWMR